MIAPEPANNEERALLGMPLLVKVIYCCKPGSVSRKIHGSCYRVEGTIRVLSEKHGYLAKEYADGGGSIWISTESLGLTGSPWSVYKVEVLP